MRVLFVAVIALASCAPDTAAPPPPQPPAPRATPPAVAAACADAPYRLCPVDEGARDPSFETFRRELLAIVAERDATRLKTLVDPHVRTSFGESEGGLQSPPWDELSKVLQLGGAFQGTGTGATFWAPYVYAKWPEAIDAFQHVAAVRSGVPIRDQPDVNGKVVATVDWEILEIIPTRRKAPDTSKWLNIKTHGGREGFVEKADVQSPVGYRAGFSKRSGKWLLEAFVAGD